MTVTSMTVISTRTIALLALVCVASFACAKHKRTDDPAGAGGAMGGSQMPGAGSGAGGSGGIGDAGSSGEAGTAASGAGGVSGSSAGGSAAGGFDAGELDAGKPDAGKPDAGDEHDADCTVAQRMDTCCFDSVAVTYRQLRADPCLAQYPGEIIELDRFESCRPEPCDVTSCGELLRPPSFFAVPSANGCAFADECTQASDCAHVQVISSCCRCSLGMPASIANEEPCYLAPNEDSETAEPCPYGCFERHDSCEGCSEFAEPACVVRDSFNICQ